MENRLTRALYDRLPIVLKSVAATAFGVTKRRRRYSAEYESWRTLFADAATWSEDRLRTFQEERLRELVTHAAEHVPFHRRRFEELGVDPRDVRDLDSLALLPPLGKEDVRAAGDDLLSDAFPGQTINRYPTSGSTGTPLIIPHAERVEQIEWAFIRSRFIPESVLDEPYSSFTGLELIPPARSKPPFWVDNWSSRQRMFSAFHLNDAFLPHYVEALESRYSAYFIGYASAMYMIAEYMLRKGIRLTRPPRFALSSSEELQPRYQEAIEAAFGCEVRNRYGQNEFVASITMYDCGHLHYDMDYSIAEFLPVEELEGGEIVAEIVGTNLHAPSWPLFRYRTGDLAVYHPDDRCEAGRPGRVIRRIHGRTGQYFTLPNGTRVTNISVIAKKCTRVRFMQVVQKTLGAITVLVVRDEGFDASDHARIESEFRKKVGSELRIDIEFVDEIERSRRGKFISIVNEVDDV